MTTVNINSKIANVDAGSPLRWGQGDTPISIGTMYGRGGWLYSTCPVCLDQPQILTKDLKA
jgi:hypothetical protein